MERKSNKRGRSIALLVVGVMIGGLLITPAGAHVGGTVGHLWKKHMLPLAKKAFYTKAQSDGRYLGKTAKAADADKLDGIDSTGFLSATGKAADAADLNCTGCVSSADVSDGTLTPADMAANAVAHAGSVSVSGSTSSNAPTTLDTVNVAVPGPGTLLVFATARYWLNADSGSTSARMTSANIGLCDTPNSATACGPTWSDIWYEDPDNTSSFNEVPSWSVSRAVPVSAAGTRTFYVNGRTNDTSAALFLYGNSQVSAVFVPNSLGVSS